MNRRRLLWFLGGGIACVAGLTALRWGVPRMMRPRWPRPLSDAAMELVQESFRGLDRDALWDSHAHIVGLGAGGSGCWINPNMQSHLHPIKRLQYDVYTQALGMDDPSTADADYVERLLAVHRAANPRGRLVLFGFDQHVDSHGVEHPERSAFFTPNDYVLRLAQEHADLEVAVSIHPYRDDALDRLDQSAERGAVAVKWLPSAMGIDPMSSQCDPFYRRLVELDLPLISHAGHEYAVDAAEDQALGNPLRLRRPLDAGVRVIVAHCASLGSGLDFDGHPPPRVSAFELFARMMEDPRYESLLFGDISAITQFNRSAEVRRRLLMAEHLHPRLINGSDYPIPGLRVLFSLGKLQLEGLITGRQRRLLDEIASGNPLLFDFVLKRSMRFRDGDRTYRFADEVFETARWFKI